MRVECIPLTSFAHGSINAHEGKALMIEERVADDLERAGLVRVKRPRPAAITTPAVEAIDAGKPPAAGEAQPSSASPAAPASPTTTAPKSGRGSKRAKSAA